MKCQVKNCDGKALVSYGSKWICGNCIMKVIRKQQEKELAELEELE